MKRRDLLKGALAPLFSGSEVSSSDPIENLQSLTQNLSPVPLSEFQSRLQKAQRLMTDNQFDALFLEGGSGLLYFTGVQWGRSERMFGAFLSRQGKLAFVCPAFEEERAREQIIFSQPDLRVWQESESAFQVAAQLLSEWGIRTGRVAVEPTTRLFLIDGMEKAAAGAEFHNGESVSDECRITKSGLEIGYLRLADRVTKRACQAALAGLREGMTEGDLRDRIARAHQKLGAPGNALVLFGPHSALPHGTKKQRALREGDLVLIDGGCQVNGYKSDVTRTGVFGEPSAKQKRVWEIVYQAQTAALEEATPGRTCESLDRAARKVISEAGWGPGHRYFTHRLGHGIGLDGHEKPYLVEGNKTVLTPGMTFSNEPGIYIPGESGVRHEDIMVITEQGAELFNERSRSIQHPV